MRPPRKAAATKPALPNRNAVAHKKQRNKRRVNRISRHDDFVMEAARGEDEEESAHGKEGEGVGPEMDPTGAAKNDAASDVDEVGSGNEIAEDVEKLGHGFPREDVAGEKDTGKDGKEGELHRLRLRGGFAGDENAERERDEDIGKGEKSEKDHAAVNRNTEEEAHGGDNHAEFKETDAEIREELAEKKTHGTDGSDEELFESAAFFFANDGEGGEKGGDVEKKDGGEAGEKKVRRAGIRVEKDFGAHVHGKSGVGGRENAAERLIEANGGGDVDGLPGDGGIGTVDEDEDLGAHLVEEFVGIVDRNFDTDATFTGNDGVVEILVIVDETGEVEGIGITEAIEEFTAFTPAVGVVNDGVDLTDVGIDAIAEKKHLENRDDQGKEEGAEIPADMERLFVEDSAEPAEGVNHERPPARPDVCW